MSRSPFSRTVSAWAYVKSCRGGLTPTTVNSEVDQHPAGPQARLDPGADRDHCGAELFRAELPHGGLARGVYLRDVRESVGELVDQRAIGVDGQHVVAEPLQILGQRAAEPAQTHHQYRARMDVLTQRSAAPRAGGTACAARAPPAPERA